MMIKDSDFLDTRSVYVLLSSIYESLLRRALASSNALVGGTRVLNGPKAPGEFIPSKHRYIKLLYIYIYKT